MNLIDSLDFLADSYWYVPEPGLPALRYEPDSQTLAWRGDQTVWHISGCAQGYFWGACSALIYQPGQAASARPSLRTLAGSVTPDGMVQINFAQTRLLKESIIVGNGRLLQIGRTWAFQMQMTASAAGELTLHWADMAPITPESPDWRSLPGAGLSVPQMLEGAVYPRFDKA
ncbi:hypothetical protein [Chromobacterium sp. IIBBL 290-4]|uniref:hypothetical protein n=1 Tax=Chromobacterium sp. IIBBL 290-4 TaxID=2953890 RepID=UPI0020B7F156|nr:hypothetical protein [Chromobacterium sp. IIBBL 290-4]UTH72778.1 hypothetical protein NKT35_14665 [Chromobacterium sp. IIBBL 290-4]